MKKTSKSIHEVFKSKTERIVNLRSGNEIYDFPGLSTAWDRRSFDFPAATTIGVWVHGQWSLLETAHWFFKDRKGGAMLGERRGKDQMKIVDQNIHNIRS